MSAWLQCLNECLVDITPDKILSNKNIDKEDGKQTH